MAPDKCLMSDNSCLNIEQLKDSLSSAGIEFLYHANTVETSLSYFRLGHLASREYLESQEMPQTWQPSDEGDKKFGIFNDLFLNFADFHARFTKKEPNRYGPILYKFSAQKVLDYYLEKGFDLRLTNKQPHLWEEGDSSSDRWTTNVNYRLIYPYKQGWTTWPDLVARGIPPFLPLSIAEEVLVDLHPENTDFFDSLEEVFISVMQAQGLSIPIRARSCSEPSCNCLEIASLDTRRRSQFKTGEWKEQYGEIA